MTASALVMLPPLLLEYDYFLIAPMRHDRAGYLRRFFAVRKQTLKLDGAAGRSG
jgi:hypothetical protein